MGFRHQRAAVGCHILPFNSARLLSLIVSVIEVIDCDSKECSSSDINLPRVSDRLAPPTPPSVFNSPLLLPRCFAQYTEIEIYLMLCTTYDRRPQKFKLKACADA